MTRGNPAAAETARDPEDDGMADAERPAGQSACAIGVPATPNPWQRPRRPHRGRRIAARVALVLACAVACLSVGFLVWCSCGYRPDAEALEAHAAANGTTEQGWATFGDSAARCGVVFYPGARVDAEAYAPLLSKLADRGAFCVLVKMPFDLAVLGIGSAGYVQAQFPQVERWYLAGHSLGGAVAAVYLGRGDNARDWDGLVLLGAYSSTDLSQSGLDVLTVVGGNDGVTDSGKLASYAANLPADARTVVIPGGNHAQFGSYGSQARDGEATVSADGQQAETVALICEFMGIGE